LIFPLQLGRGGDATLLTGLDRPLLIGELVLFSLMPCNIFWTCSGLFGVGEPAQGKEKAGR